MIWALRSVLLLVPTLFGLSATAQHEFSKEGARACLECHESEKVMGIIETPHANFENPDTPAAREQCESCHGPSARHMQFPMQVGNIRFSKHDRSTPVAQRNAACMQCHGTKIELDETNRPTPETWPNNGMGNIYPDGGTGSCTACHSRHKFSIAEARHPHACAHPVAVGSVEAELGGGGRHRGIQQTDLSDIGEQEEVGRVPVLQAHG